jgi:hypothetical protein
MGFKVLVEHSGSVLTEDSVATEQSGSAARSDEVLRVLGVDDGPSSSISEDAVREGRVDDLIISNVLDLVLVVVLVVDDLDVSDTPTLVSLYLIECGGKLDDGGGVDVVDDDFEVVCCFFPSIDGGSAEVGDDSGGAVAVHLRPNEDVVDVELSLFAVPRVNEPELESNGEFVVHR